MLQPAADHQSLRAAFRWDIPERFNIGVAVCDRWAAIDPERVALIDRRADGGVDRWSHGRLAEASNRFANVLRAHGVRRGDRVAILLGQSPETLITHIALYKLGAIALPLAAVFGVEALGYRLADAGARALVTSAAGVAKAADGGLLGALDLLVSADGPAPGAVGFHEACGLASSRFEPEPTAADDPALLIYTSGTTGPPKGALHAHRVLLGHLPGVQMPHEFLPQPGDLLWTPADWAWAGGLLNILLSGLYLGVPVLGTRMEKFDPERVFRLMAEQGVRNTFLPPTALRLLRAMPSPRGRFDLRLRTVASGGEALGRETLEWGREALGLTINEFYGQTECNLVLASCAAIGISRPGAIGLAVPGHDVAIIDATGAELPVGTQGQIAVRRPDPVMFLGYWGNPEATEKKFVGDWLTTGDEGIRDADGYIQFVGRDDDVITSSGYRIGPGEIEDCLAGHPAVALAAVVGKPDPIRTEIVKAYVRLKDGFAPSDALAGEIGGFVRSRLSAHEYPREVAFVDDVPLTTTGKVIRRMFRERAKAEAGGT